jgi:hypothetical protein
MLTLRSEIGPSYRRFHGADERVAVFGRENRINQQVREGSAYTCITRQNGVIFIQKRPAFQDESGTASLSRAMHRLKLAFMPIRSTPGFYHPSAPSVLKSKCPRPTI